MRTIVSLFAGLLVATSASAQSFTGPYIGGYLGGGSGDAEWQIGGGSRIEHSLDGGFVGVQGGYNWTPGGWLLGVQGDLGIGNLEGSSRCPNAAFECKTEWLSLLTVRGRAGPIINNTFAIYATAGIASGGIRTSVDNNAGSKDEDVQGHPGWTAGLGVTGLVGRHITWQAEFLHVDLGEEEHILQGVTNKVKANASFFRIGVHYKFF